MNRLPAEHDWTLRAACIGQPDAVFFPRTGQNANQAKAICRQCPVRRTCLEQALAAEQDVPVSARHGVFGGLSPQERIRLAARRAS